jgi:spore photoproduct lyase
LIVLTKAVDVENLLDLDHARHTTLSWSLNSPEICAEFEQGSPLLRDRVKAMRKCAEAGYTIRAVIMPVIPAPGWQETYAAFISDLLAQVPLERMTLGGVCSYPAARRLMEAKLGADNAISSALGQTGGKSLDGRSRYPASQRIELYGYLIDVIRKVQPELPTSLCLEELEVFRALGLVRAIGRCNCVL